MLQTFNIALHLSVSCQFSEVDSTKNVLICPRLGTSTSFTNWCYSSILLVSSHEAPRVPSACEEAKVCLHLSRSNKIMCPRTQSVQLYIRGCSQMTSAFFGVSDTPWCLCQPIISFWPAPWCFKLTMSFVNSPEPKIIIFRWSLKTPNQPSICPKRGLVEPSESLVRPNKAFFGWIPSIFGIFHHSSSIWCPLVTPCQFLVAFEVTVGCSMLQRHLWMAPYQ